MPDYGCWPLWVMKIGINPCKYISDKSLLNDNSWSDAYTSIDPQYEFKCSKDDYNQEIEGIILSQDISADLQCNPLNENVKYVVNMHSNILGKRTSNMRELLKELLYTFLQKKYPKNLRML
jgi:hypothetical protein